MEPIYHYFYENPINAELKIDSSGIEPEKLVEKIYNYIEERGFISEKIDD